MVKIEDVLKYTNDEDLQNIFQKKVEEEGGEEDLKNIKNLIGDKILQEEDIVNLINNFPENSESQKENLLKNFEKYMEQQKDIQNYYEEKIFKLGVMEAITIIIEYFKNKGAKEVHTERVISEIGQVVIPIEYRNSLNWEYKDKLDVILDEESKEVRLKKIIK